MLCLAAGSSGAQNTAVTPFLLKNETGNTTDITTLKGKVLFLNFWALTCIPCKTEMPTINKLKERFKDDSNVLFFEIDLDNNLAASAKYMRDKGFALGVFFAASAVPQTLFRGELPTTAIIDRAGNIVYFHEGEDDYSSRKFIDILDGLTRESPARKSLAPIKVEWVDNVKGDFSFKNKWDYPEGVYKNKFGQVSCDGLCPPEVEHMMDANGRIYRDSLRAFYRLVDTAHMYHSLACEARCYEFGEADYVNVMRYNNDSVHCYSLCNAVTHSSLRLDIVNGNCATTIKLNSIAPHHKGNSNKVYYCKSGYIKIDKALWKKGIMKAAFSFDFYPEGEGESMYWKGRIYKKMTKQ